MYMKLLHYVSNFKELTTDFWFHIEHEQWPPDLSLVFV